MVTSVGGCWAVGGAALGVWAGGVGGAPLPSRLQYSSSLAVGQLVGVATHFPCPPDPLLVRRYEVVFSELGREGGRGGEGGTSETHQDEALRG